MINPRSGRPDTNKSLIVVDIQILIKPHRYGGLVEGRTWIPHPLDFVSNCHTHKPHLDHCSS